MEGLHVRQFKTTPALRAAQKRYHDKARQRYRDKGAEYTASHTLAGTPRKCMGRHQGLTGLVRAITKYRTWGALKNAVRQGEISHEQVPSPLREKIPPGLGTGRSITKHKEQWGETLEQMGKRLGISKEAVRIRIRVWGSPEPVKALKQPGEKHYVNSKSFISPRRLYVWGYQSLEQLAQETDHKLLRLSGMGPKKLALLRAHFPQVDTNTEVV